MSKSEARKEALKLRRQLSPREVQALSASVRENLLHLPEYNASQIIACYVAKQHEVQTAEILKMALASGKRIVVPRSDPVSFSLTFHEIHGLDELQLGNFGVLEPAQDSKTISLTKVDLVIVPVVAWDSRGNRMGYGMGYFDRALKDKGKVRCVGLAFEIQLRDPLPTSSTDIPLDMIITEKRVVRFEKEGRW